MQYDQVRKQEAKALGVRPVTLDAVFRDARKGTAADARSRVCASFQVDHLDPLKNTPSSILDQAYASELLPGF